MAPCQSASPRRSASPNRSASGAIGRCDLKAFFQGVVDRGLTAVDLLNEEQWTVANESGLKCSMANVGAGGINEGLNNPKHHETLINADRADEDGLPKLKAAAFPNAICFFGKRRRDVGLRRDQELHRVPQADRADRQGQRRERSASSC